MSQVKPQVIGLAGDGLLGLGGLSGLCGYFCLCGLDNDIHVSSGMVDHILHMVDSGVVDNVLRMVELYVGSHQAAILSTLCSRHSVPFVSGISTVGIAMPGKHSAWAQLGTGCSKGFAKRHAIAHATCHIHGVDGFYFGVLIGGVGRVTQCLGNSSCAGAQQDSDTATNGYLAEGVG